MSPFVKGATLLTSTHSDHHSKGGNYGKNENNDTSYASKYYSIYTIKIKIWNRLKNITGVKVQG